MAHLDTTRAAAAALLLATSLLGAGRASADAVDNLAQELIKLRGEVEELNAQLNSDKESHRAQMRSLAQQRGELEAAVQREEIRISKLEKSLADNRERARQLGTGDESLRPVVLQAIDELRADVRAGLPFKVEERVSELDELEGQVQAEVVAPAKAANRLWAFYEDEIGLTGENGLYSQTISLDGERRLADVARLGMVMMYFRTSDGRVGHAVRDAGDWKYLELVNTDDRRRINALFDGLQKQIRTGYFELPNPLSGSR